MPDKAEYPRGPIESRARLIFFYSWGLVPTIAILDSSGAINADEGIWISVRILISVVWGSAGLTWFELSRRRAKAERFGESRRPV